MLPCNSLYEIICEIGPIKKLKNSPTNIKSSKKINDQEKLAWG